MLLDKVAETGIGGRNIRHFKALGYNVRPGDKIIVPLEHLTNGSNAKVSLVCDFCGKELIRSYRAILSERESCPLDCCVGCSWKKSEITNEINYGVKNVMHVKEFVDNHKRNCLEKYGVENPSSLPETREKVKRTFLERYGVDNYTKTEEYLIKSKKTNLKKYGVEHYNKTEEYLERVKKTNIEKYGVDNPNKNPEIVKKTRKTCLKKYGVDNYFKSDEFKIKNMTHNLKTHGVEYYSQSEDFRDKSAKTWREKTPEEILEIKTKANETMSKNGTCKTSFEQNAIFEMLKDNGYDVVLNHPDGKFNFDILLTVDNVKIDVEYDGWYWHKDRHRQDFIRDCMTKRKGYKVLRIKSRTLIPEFSEIKESIDKLVFTDYKFEEIKMSDWSD